MPVAHNYAFKVKNSRILLYSFIRRWLFQAGNRNVGLILISPYFVPFHSRFTILLLNHLDLYNAIEIIWQNENFSYLLELFSADQVVKADEAVANKQKEFAEAIKNDCDKELETAMPILDAALKALNTITQNVRHIFLFSETQFLIHLYVIWQRVTSHHIAEVIIS